MLARRDHPSLFGVSASFDIGMDLQPSGQKLALLTVEVTNDHFFCVLVIGRAVLTLVSVLHSNSFDWLLREVDDK